MQQKAPWLRTLETESGGCLLAVRRYLKPEACCKSTTLQMIQIQILAGSSDKPSISPEGFSHSIFTGFVCSDLRNSVPKPLKDASLWPWIGGGGGVCTQWRTWLFILASASWGSCHSFSVIHVSPMIGWCLALERWGMVCSGIEPAGDHTEPRTLWPETSSYSLVFSRRSVLCSHVSCTGREIRCSFCLFSHFLFLYLLIFL